MIYNLFDTLDFDISKQESIEWRKKFTSIRHDAELNAKPDACYLCHNHLTNFCKSHTVPQFCLRSIAKNGKIKNALSFFDINLMPDENGVSNAGVFYLICKDCDNLFLRSTKLLKTILTKFFQIKF